MPVGVLAIQGDFAKHLEVLRSLGVEGVEVRTVEGLDGVDRLIVPGGESTTVGLLLEWFGLGDAIRRRVAEGMPIWGTCMGMIIMAKAVEGRPNQSSLGLLDVTVRRNAFGSQVHSFEDSVEVEGIDEPVMGVFIRAPVVVESGPAVKELACYKGQVVAVLEGSRLGTSFHPELTDDPSVHRYFLGLPVNSSR